MLRFIKTILFVFVPFFILAQKQTSLQTQIDQLVQGFHGIMGIYVKNLKTGETASYHADTLFPTASMVKIPILIGIMDKFYKNELDYHQNLVYNDSMADAREEDILASFKSGETIELSKLIMLMLTMSDNTASLWLQRLAGGGQRINEIMQEQGFANTRVNSRTPGREIARNQYGWGVTTPKEMVTIFEKIYNGNILNPVASQRMLRLLGRNYWDEECIGQVPTNIFVADKVGAVDASRSETLLAVAPHGTYIFSVITKNQADTSWHSENEGWILERKLSHLLWNYFEPHSNWKPYIDFNGKIINR